MNRLGRMARLWASLIVGPYSWGCGEEPASDTVTVVALDDASVPEASAPEMDLGEAEASLGCRPAQASDKLRARGPTMRRALAARASVSTRELFQKFNTYCKGCHVDQGLGGFRVANRSAFVEQTDAGVAQGRAQKILELLRTDDPALIMPPGSTPLKNKPADDGLVQFAALMEAWLAAGAPENGFEAAAPSTLGASPYVLPERVGRQLTNLGNCIPDKDDFAEEQDRSAELDKLFEQAKELPERLDQTDLFTLDSQELARHGVVAFAPAYTLWADNAKKLRMLRVPRGKKIEFDEETQSFSIPSNTRFYKTFLKRVIDRDGNESYRKMETRLIVSRADSDDKTLASNLRHNALFGTYAWNEQETEAILVRDPLRNGQPFADRLVPYQLNEQKVKQLIEAGEPDLEKKIKDEGLGRTYAIPGSERCIHCHMGAPNHSFVLGFTPLQIHRRPKGKSGVIEPAEADELNQLQRLIDYGVVGGMESPDEVVLLENSQGERKPRNNYELDAQGYMLGNCAHCHNPRGFPSEIATELRDQLNFQPDPEDGGIFQFPLEKYSPRIFRGVDQNIQIPYITPSLYDRAPAYVELFRVGGESSAGRQKLQQCPSDSLIVDSSQEPAAPAGTPYLAPWRSLIYRNVDTPFSYSDDSTIFPHMPRDTPGFDCRAKQLLGVWMTSIPARLKVAPEPPPAGGRYKAKLLFHEALCPEPLTADGACPGEQEQPYEEISPDDPEYFAFLNEASSRVWDFKNRGRYQDCPDPDLDIVDPVIEEGFAYTFPPLEQGFTREADSCDVPGDFVPGWSHWFDMDLSDATGEWRPRREDWASVLVEGEIVDPTTADPKLTTAEQARNEQDRMTVHLLTGKDPWERLPPRPDVHVTEGMRTFALRPFPMGLWEAKSECECKLQQSPRDVVPLASDYTEEDRPRWLEHKQTAPRIAAAPDAPVFTITPGAQVFNSICSNCHGPHADSRGRMADTIADMTGGDTRVANLRDGFFGPVGAAGTNRTPLFEASAAGTGVNAENWAARYLLWMGSGGTRRMIPPAVLNVVATTRVLGVKRQGLTGLGNVGANMLAVGDFLCGHALPRFASGNTVMLRFDVVKGMIDNYEKYPVDPERPPKEPPPLALISNNGDAELWQELCTADNPAPVRAVTFHEGRFMLAVQLQTRSDLEGKPTFDENMSLLLRREGYGSGPVGDHRGRIRDAIDGDNVAPWCVLQPAAEQERQALEVAYRRLRDDDDEPLPYCPERLLGSAQRFGDLDARYWTRRGSMNAGLAVFFYLDALARGQQKTAVEYNHCEDLPEVCQ
jgi:mono/diheme cytochrome c family protein